MFEILKATERAAIAAFHHIGKNDKYIIDKVATDAMREALNEMPFVGRIVAAEGEKDKAPTFTHNELVGAERSCCYAPKVRDIVCDPVDGTTPASRGQRDAISVLAMGEDCSLFSTKEFYMFKLAWNNTFPGWKTVNDLKYIRETIQEMKHILKRELVVCVLDRPRHKHIVDIVKEEGCRIKFIQDCDVGGAILTMSKVDVYIGVGGASEGVLAASALKCLGGKFQGIICDKEGKPKSDKVLNIDDLVYGDTTFVASGITDGDLLDGVKKTDGYLVSSVYMNKDGVRYIKSQISNSQLKHHANA